MNRWTWVAEAQEPASIQYDFEASMSSETQVIVQSAEDQRRDIQDAGYDILFFDPPYFDYISYDELSAFHRAWLGQAMASSGIALVPDPNGTSGSFGIRLGKAIANALEGRRGSLPLAFTYHSSHRSAWEALAVALDEAKLSITAAWPVRSDGHMGHHSRYDGSCEWDIVLVARPIHETQPARFPNTASELVDLVHPLHVGEADRRNFDLAVETVMGRYGRSI